MKTKVGHVTCIERLRFLTLKACPCFHAVDLSAWRAFAERSVDLLASRMEELSSLEYSRPEFLM